MKKEFGDDLYLSFNVLWRTVHHERGHTFLSDTPLCANSTCHRVLDVTAEGFFCQKCVKNYPYAPYKDSSAVVREVRARWEGYPTLNSKVYSLDLPPTKVRDEDKEDEHYWVQAQIVEKDGRKMAVIYFGERLKEQSKADYSQVFLDFENEQLRFDKNNKNPMVLLSKLTAEFKDSVTELKKAN